MSHRLAIEITAPTITVSPSDKVVINVALQNTGEHAIYVNARFVVAPHAGELRPKVLRAGKDVPFRYAIMLLPVKASDFVLVEPGQRIVTGWPINRDFRMTERGTYTVQIDYVNEDVPKEFGNLPVFTGRVTSAPVTLTLG